MYTQVKNPRWADVDHSAIECEVVFDHVGVEFVPFGANPNDQYEHAREIFARCVAGDFGPVAEFVEPVVEAAPTESQPTVNGAQTL